MQPTAKLITLLVSQQLSSYYCTPTALQRQNSCSSPLVFLIYSLLGNIIMQAVLAIVKNQNWKMRLVVCTVIVQETFNRKSAGSALSY